MNEKSGPQAASQCPNDRRPRPTFDLGRVLERRRAHCELNALLNVRGYPDIAVTYSLRSSLEDAS